MELPLQRVNFHLRVRVWQKYVVLGFDKSLYARERTYVRQTSVVVQKYFITSTLSYVNVHAMLFT